MRAFKNDFIALHSNGGSGHRGPGAVPQELKRFFFSGVNTFRANFVILMTDIIKTFYNLTL